MSILLLISSKISFGTNVSRYVYLYYPFTNVQFTFTLVPVQHVYTSPASFSTLSKSL